MTTGTNAMSRILPLIVAGWLLAAGAHAETVYFTIDFRVKPEGVQQFIDTITEAAPDTRGFDGCLQFDVMQDREDPTHFVFYEVWTSPAEHQAYQKWRATTDLGATLTPLLSQPPVAHELTLIDP